MPTALCLFTLLFQTIPLRGEEEEEEEMLRNCEKMVAVITSSATNEWPQKLMEKPSQEQQQVQQQQALKCPRCDSSNTKFCYYNNYSLSQPRHFCKACKRYWTRGGTLRNVPVGGGCRKNKRVKRPTVSASTPPSIGGASPTSGGGVVNPNSTTSSHHINPLFYGLTANDPYHDVINLPFSRSSTVTGYDLQPQMSGLGLGFSSGDNTDHYPPLLSSYTNIFGSSSSSSTTTTTPTIASLLASTLNQHKFINGGVKNTEALPPFQDLQTTAMKDIKVPCQNHLEQITLPDPSLYWSTNIGVWHDPTNIGSSVTSLI